MQNVWYIKANVDPREAKGPLEREILQALDESDGLSENSLQQHIRNVAELWGVHPQSLSDLHHRVSNALSRLSEQDLIYSVWR